MQIILHIGHQKTASTTIQAYLAQNRKRLAAQQILYPASFGDNKAHLASELLTEDRRLAASQEQIISEIQSEFSGNYTKAILSNENFFASDERFLRRLKKTLEPYATSWRVLGYVRRPDEHIVSLYQQKVKGGYTRTFDDFFEERLQRNYYNYSQHLDRWAEVFGRGSVEVRLFHRKALRGSPIDDFVQWVGIDRTCLSTPERQHANESLDLLNAEIVRFLNLCETKEPDLIRKHDMRGIKARLRALDTGGRRRLDDERARLLLDRFRDDHERLAERFLSPDDTVLLLAPPVEVPPQSSFDREALFDRMMTLFSDRNLAQRAVEAAAGKTWVPGGAQYAKKGTKVERILERRERATKRQERASKQRRWPAKAARLMRSYWRAGLSWVRSDTK